MVKSKVNNFMRPPMMLVTPQSHLVGRCFLKPEVTPPSDSQPGYAPPPPGHRNKAWTSLAKLGWTEQLRCKVPNFYTEKAGSKMAPK